MNRHWRTLQADLDELERTDPAVRAAAESYDRMVERLTAPGRCTAASLTQGRRRCQQDRGHGGPHQHEDGDGITVWGIDRRRRSSMRRGNDAR